jgi:hypothetical protein
LHQPQDVVIEKSEEAMGTALKKLFTNPAILTFLGSIL